MKDCNLWSVRMRASTDGPEHPRHLSGAERIVDEPAITAVAAEMLSRARSKSPQKIDITLEQVPSGACRHVHCLPVHTVHSSGPDHAAAFATEMLIRAGVAPVTALAGLAALRNGLGPGGGALRGASLWDKTVGKRLEPNTERGVRTSRFDYSVNGAAAIDVALTNCGLTHYRTREALAVATKTLWSGVSAELCWSDDADYATGYVAIPQDGYIRLPGFKPVGAPGGRIFFVNGDVVDIEHLVHRLEREFVLIEPPAWVNEPVSVEEFLERA